MYTYVEILGGDHTAPDAAVLIDEVRFWSDTRAHVNLDHMNAEFISAGVDTQRRVVAGIAAHFIIDVPDMIYVDSLFTCQHHEGNGLSTALVGMMLDAERFRRAEQVRLIPKIGSLGFYQGLGFEPVEPDNPHGLNTVSVDNLRTSVQRRQQTHGVALAL